MRKEFHSNGKLLLSGEYAILEGAQGLAIPTQYGQSLTIKPTNSKLLEWTSLDEKQNVWFEGTYTLDSLKGISISDNAISSTLILLLKEAKSQNPGFLNDHNGIKVETNLSFPRDWGLGTSSTLINNIAQWANIDAYQLLWNAFGGSGYDIACSRHNSPILYQIVDGTPKVEEVNFNPPFKDSIHFVYLNQKQSSKEAIAAFRERDFNKNQLILDISDVTKGMVDAQTLTDFESMMTKHEEVLSKILGLPPIKSKFFKDYPGAIKSLGAWGGDFIMATGKQNALDYFSDKGFNTIFSFSEMILQNA
ncbi:GYDIA family GHMP kinase [Flagellimonas pacifica]|uniref:Mevalonate kinase n=1 Tax=Flagellimonas pacifica TaxID=1247520 RepID=A0A285MBC2_9FLAO|nr:GYDIA family GHMP kinase [Allomuricauda parva]SNY94492.1 Mevalonate kinase [Allomuricauda parva]